MRLHLNQKRIWCPRIRIIGSKVCLSMVFPRFFNYMHKIFQRGPDFHLRWQNVHPNSSGKWRVVQMCKCSTSVHKTVKGCFGRISVCLPARRECVFLMSKNAFAFLGSKNKGLLHSLENTPVEWRAMRSPNTAPAREKYAPSIARHTTHVFSK